MFRKKIPFVAYGNEELRKKPPLCLGDKIICPHCEEEHVVSGGKGEDGKETDLVMFYKCGKQVYLAGVKGKNVITE